MRQICCLLANTELQSVGCNWGVKSTCSLVLCMGYSNFRWVHWCGGAIEVNLIFAIWHNSNHTSHLLTPFSWDFSTSHVGLPLYWKACGGVIMFCNWSLCLSVDCVWLETVSEVHSTYSCTLPTAFKIRTRLQLAVYMNDCVLCTYMLQIFIIISVSIIIFISYTVCA